MPVVRAHDPEHRQCLVRRVRAVRGHTRIRTRVAPRPDYGRARPRLTAVDGGVLVEADGIRLGLSSTAPLVIEGDEVVAEVDLDDVRSGGVEHLFVLQVLEPGQDLAPVDCADNLRLVERTAEFWRDWLARSTYTGRWREMVNRSAITLKLLTHEPSGAVVAAPTTSLPEEIGGGRNWDYRYVWIRDAAFTIYALLKLGFTAEAAAFMEWLSERMGEGVDDPDLGPLPVSYTHLTLPTNREV